MLQKEFEERAIKVTEREFSAINAVYEYSDLEKDEFCKLWCKMNYARVAAYKKAQKKLAVEQANKDLLYSIYWKLADMQYFLPIDENLSKKELSSLKEAGIEIYSQHYNAENLYKQTVEVRYDLGRALKIIK